MIEIKNKSWSDVTIDMWQELSLIETESEITKLIEQISILADCDSDYVRKMPMTEFRKFTKEVAFLAEPPKADVLTKFEIDGKWYGIIPQLDFISTGEWLDAENWKDKPIENIHLYAALIYRPITKDEGDVYEIEEHKSSGFLERANLFRERLPITTIHGAVLFFSTSVIGLMPIMEEYFKIAQQEN